MATTTTRTEDQILAAAAAGHEMAGMAPTEGDIAAARRILRQETTIEQERDRVLAEIKAARS